MRENIYRDYAPQERLKEIIEILAEGVLSLVKKGIYFIPFLSISNLGSDVIVREDIKISIVNI